MPISDIGKAEEQPISQEVIARLAAKVLEMEAQQQELARLCQAVQAAEVENQRLRARVAELEGRDINRFIEANPVPVPVLAGDSASEYAGMPWEGRP